MKEVKDREWEDHAKYQVAFVIFSYSVIFV